MGAPSGPMRNFSKFQAMSVLLTGRQIRNWGFAIRLSGSSLGAGRDFFRNLNIGCSFSPLASTYKSLTVILSNLKKPYLVKQCSFELKPISRPDMLQSIDDFLSSRIFLVAKLKLLYFKLTRYNSWFRRNFTWFVGKARTANFPEN